MFQYVFVETYILLYYVPIETTHVDLHSLDTFSYVHNLLRVFICFVPLDGIANPAEQSRLMLHHGVVNDGELQIEISWLDLVDFDFSVVYYWVTIG